jgi:hypothetical protein
VCESEKRGNDFPREICFSLERTCSEIFLSEKMRPLGKLAMRLKEFYLLNLMKKK